MSRADELASVSGGRTDRCHGRTQDATDCRVHLRAWRNVPDAVFPQHGGSEAPPWAAAVGRRWPFPFSDVYVVHTHLEQVWMAIPILNMLLLYIIYHIMYMYMTHYHYLSFFIPV